MRFQQRLRDIRVDRGLKQFAVASFLGMKQTLYSRYERGACELPMHHFITLARLYNVSLDYLAGLVDTPRTLDGSPYRVSKNYSISQNGNGGTINNTFN